ncbi:superoxide dismutase family protein [uncultured Algimonas sp.]|uniref:superoxide dismutase family protein n=1 Tax=uncultured Algimonas sp. TaxID=1547920 RepID=UPI00260CA8F9|nr:superoxide dismutase family protein [uncultured Algimonas sp.]
MTIRRHYRWIGLVALPTCLSACASVTVAPPDAVRDTSDKIYALASPPAAPRDEDASAAVIDRNGNVIGSALLYQGSDGVVMRLSVSGVAPGVHGMHFHAKGTCEDPQDGFKATGGHVMPFGKPHGYMHPDGPHAGNLPNLIVAADGTTTVELYTGLVSLSDGPAALLDADGSTLIIHENEDDHLTQPIGGAGGRIACGVIDAAS